MAWVSELWRRNERMHNPALDHLCLDPGNRRIVWNNIINAKKQDKAILLTSHSMTECDVLCSRLAIMVNGQFKCFGTPQHLKHRFGTGYYLKLRLEHESAIQVASNIVHQFLPEANMTVRITDFLFRSVDSMNSI
jgi:ATP-binding cassette subfamily A (ABC1) protein 1